ncbi:GNAT family N-acetyltransferase [Nocardioides sp.]|uniref:GNAT family N-acetyltransferase n=1 Tax=Nocardioides sp. TaxID=35761 RepID=UPI002BF2A3F2|nr:GNAT family N-acetyltransferase [Nocardioides sp.]HXH78818.1 GNAT family N-acetyltransferase [Nocardioides sp.]
MPEVSGVRQVLASTDAKDMSVRLVVTQGDHQLVGVVRDGESWRAAAERTAGALSGEPVAVDLSGDVKQFAIEHDRVVSLRAMTRGDLPQVARWRQQPHVQRWWSDEGEPTLEGVTEKYGERIDGTTPTRMWVAEVNGRSVGFVQDYRLSDYPDYALLAPDPEAIGVDYAIGESEWVGRGLGVRILWAWMLKIEHRLPDARCYFAAPDHRNAASLRMLEKLGFERGVWFDEPRSDGAVDTVVGWSLDVSRVLGVATP